MISIGRPMGWLAVVPATIAALPLYAQTGPAAFAPPETPIILTRSLYLPFPDGKQIAVTRRYEIRFSRSGAGFRLDGRLLDTHVEAPPRLSALADLERRRPDGGLFPVLLDRRGMILESLPTSGDAKPTLEAADGARAMIAQAAAPQGLRDAMDGALDSLTASTRRSDWPSFLFNPGQIGRIASRTVNLPDGTQGRAETRISVDGFLAGGIPRQVERSVTTYLEGTQRITREVWTFSFRGNAPK